ncbi:MAG: hypothetical protein JSV52_02420 [Candidatus Zixiibacteriota bacterium]|nr:MAG: hypothetical protein JSV52_02420 [candidate division Zixibacteria bacterium]
MIKRDRIFYIACGLLVVGIILAFMDEYIALLPLVGAYLLRPSLHALGLAKKYADERQIQIFSRSGNIGFLVVMFGATILAILRQYQGEPPDDFHLLIFLGLVTKAIIGLLMVGDLRNAGVVILISYGVIMGVFAGLQGFDEILAGETPWETFAGIGLIVVFVALGLLARKFPRPVAIVLMLGAVGMIWYRTLWEFSDKDNGIWLFVILPLALIIACLWGRPDTDTFAVSEQ